MAGMSLGLPRLHRNRYISEVVSQWMKYLCLISALCICQTDFIMVQSPELGCRVVCLLV